MAKHLHRDFEALSMSTKIHAASLAEFTPVRLIGTGTFGKVTVMIYNATKAYVAVKSMKKEDVVRLKQVEHVHNEKELLSFCNHPFIVRLYCTFKDEEYLHMVMEYIPGGELFSRLRRVGHLSVDAARFYAAQITLALQYLHERHIVYRDLKPENVLLDAQGYLRLADFGFAKKVEDKTWTLCGTPEYLAPEVIQSRGYGRAVDWWAFGVLLYEMLVGYPPFYDENPFGIYEKILAAKVHYPSALDSVAKDLIKKIIVVDRTKRYGCMKNGAEDIKEHKFFKDLDWDHLLQRRITPPYVPIVHHNGDTANFGEFDEDSVGNLPAQYVPKPPTGPVDMKQLFANF